MVSKKPWNNGCGVCGWPALLGRSGWKEEINVAKHARTPMSSVRVAGLVQFVVVLPVAWNAVPVESSA